MPASDRRNQAPVLTEGEILQMTNENTPPQTKERPIEDGRFDTWSLEDFAGQCRMQARDNLDPEYSAFMTALGERLRDMANTPSPQTNTMGDLERCARIAHAVYEDEIGRRDACLSEGPPNCEGALTRARQAQTAQEIETQIRALMTQPPSGVYGLIKEAANLIQKERDNLFSSFQVDGRLVVEDEIDARAVTVIGEMDGWLLRAKAALYGQSATPEGLAE
jgi:hypothetical protein